MAWKAGTLRCYSTGEKLYAKYCDDNHRPEGERYPPSPMWLLRFATYMFTTLKKSAGVVSTTLSAVRSLTVAMGGSVDPFEAPNLKLALRSMRTLRKAKKRPKRLPITIWALARMKGHVIGKDHKETVLFAAILLGFHCLLRASEFVSKDPYGATLLRKHITIDDDKVSIHLARSKTDSYDEGITITTYATNNGVCPLAWLNLAMSTAPNQHPEAPVFQRSNGDAMTYQDLQRYLALLCKRAGLCTQSFKTHSLRIGGATSLMSLGFTREEIMELGRWKSDSYRLYIHHPERLRVHVAARLKKAAEDSSAPVFCGMSLKAFSVTSASTFVPFPTRSSASVPGR